MRMVRRFRCNRLQNRAAWAGAVAAALTGAVAQAAVVQVDTVASTNAFVLRSSATTDQSEAETLVTKRLNDTNTRVAYLRFNLPTGLVTDDIVSATLRLKFVSNSVLASTTVSTDTVRVYGLNDLAANSTTDESNWTGGLTFNTQPAGILANASTALPTANTTALLGSSFVTVANTTNPTSVPAVIDILLDPALFKSMVANDTNDQLTLLFHNLANTTMNWASISNTGGHEQPTLMLDVNAVPEPASVGLALVAAALMLQRRTSRSAANAFDAQTNS